MDVLRTATLAFPLLALVILLEAFYLFRKKGSLPRQEMLASLAIAVGQKVIGVFTAGLLYPLFLSVWQLRLFDLSAETPLGIGCLFVATEFSYYWFHRLSHECRWLWATHSVHHSARHFNLSASYRLGWTGILSGAWAFSVPLIWLGFHPAAVVTMLGLNLLYQFWLHTEVVAPLGAVELIFNTPSLHRVHHSSDAPYLDKNFGGVLMIFDHLFGTYQAERPEVEIHYGLVGVAPTTNPFKLAFHEWWQMGRDLRECRTWKEGLRVLFGPPR